MVLTLPSCINEDVILKHNVFSNIYVYIFIIFVKFSDKSFWI